MSDEYNDKARECDAAWSAICDAVHSLDVTTEEFERFLQAAAYFTDDDVMRIFRECNQPLAEDESPFGRWMKEHVVNDHVRVTRLDPARVLTEFKRIVARH